MYQFFNNNTIISKFIKDILKDAYVPSVPIWKPGNPTTAGFIYITKDYIVKALKDMPKDTTFNLSALSNGYFKILSPYVFGNFYPGLTSKFVSQSSIYDSETHKFLGNYLRMIRDLKDIDLMSYYNCWDNTFSDKIRINYSKVLSSNKLIFNKFETLNNKKDGLKGIIVPIKFGTEYTIYANSSVDMLMVPMFYDGINILSQSSNITKNLYVKNGSTLNKPFLYKSPTIEGLKESGTPIQNLYLEKYLKLFIQLPETNANNILILEGNYLDNKFFNTTIKSNNSIKNNEINGIKSVILGKKDKSININEYLNNLEKVFISVPSLSRNIGSKTLAFSDRLIEYLLSNVITKNDTISQNISRVQDTLSSYLSEKINKVRYNKANYISGIWDDNLRLFIYNLVTNDLNRKRIDINGYIDKDTEKIIMVEEK